mgnify:CR=1 FL=1
MLPVKEVNIVPTFKCNLNCDFCLYSELRKDFNRTLLSVETLEKILNVLKREDSGLKRVAVFGGEILLLERDYIYDLFSLIRKIFPDVAFGVVTNLLELPSWFESFVKHFTVYVSTSYEGLRFKPGSYLFKQWEENLEHVKSFLQPGINFVLTRDEKAYTDTLEVIKKHGIRHVHLINFTIPDYFPPEKKNYLYERYALTPSEYFQKFTGAIKYLSEFGIFVRGSTPITYTPLETLEIRPEGSVVITSFSEDGFPFEKELIINYEEERTIVNSRKRVDVIVDWLTNYPCVTCSLPMQYCLMEVRYPGVCPGVPDEETIYLLNQAEAEKVSLCLK